MKSPEEARHDAELARIADAKRKRKAGRKAKPKALAKPSPEEAKAQAIADALARGDYSLAKELENDD